MSGEVNLLSIYHKIKQEVDVRVKGFKDIWERGNDVAFFKELVFCLLTPQSKAINADKVVRELFSSFTNFLSFSEMDVKKIMSKNGVRFSSSKARYICLIRNRFIEKEDLKSKLKYFWDNELEAREVLVREILGFGYKEASHFLRNIGFSDNLAILDRHILNGLYEYEVIDFVPKRLSKRLYINIENKMRDFAMSIGIPMLYLDFIFWYRKTSFVFK